MGWDLQLESRAGRVGKGWGSEILGHQDFIGEADRCMMGRLCFFRATDEPGQPGNSESGLFDERDVDLPKSRSIKSGDEVLYILAITFDFELGESGGDGAINW